jgi:hypothetical protein
MPVPLPPEEGKEEEGKEAKKKTRAKSKTVHAH